MSVSEAFLPPGRQAGTGAVFWRSGRPGGGMRSAFSQTGPPDSAAGRRRRDCCRLVTCRNWLWRKKSGETEEVQALRESCGSGRDGPSAAALATRLSSSGREGMKEGEHPVSGEEDEKASLGGGGAAVSPADPGGSLRGGPLGGCGGPVLAESGFPGRVGGAAGGGSGRLADLHPLLDLGGPGAPWGAPLLAGGERDAPAASAPGGGRAAEPLPGRPAASGRPRGCTGWACTMPPLAMALGAARGGGRLPGLDGAQQEKGAVRDAGGEPPSA